MTEYSESLERIRRGLAQGGAIRGQGLLRLVDVAAGTGQEALDAREILLSQYGSDALAEEALRKSGLFDLAGALQDAVSEDVDKRWRAVAHINPSLHPRALEALRAATEDPVARVRRTAVRAFGKDVGDVEVVAKCLTDRDFYVRHTALKALLDMVVDEARLLWHPDKRDTRVSEDIRDAIRDRVAMELDETGEDDAFLEMVAALGLWESDAVLDVAQRCCFLGHAPAPLVYMLVGTGRRSDLEAVLSASCRDGQPRMEVLRALMASTGATELRVGEALRERFQKLPEEAMGCRAALVLTAAHLKVPGIAPLARQVFDMAWEVHPKGGLVRRMLEAMTLIGKEAADVARQPIEYALDSPFGPVTRVARVAAYEVLGRRDEETHLIGYAEGSHIGSGKHSIRSVYDAFIGMNEDARLRGFAAYALRNAADPADVDEAIRSVMASRGFSADSLGWRARVVAAESLVHLGLNTSEDYHKGRLGPVVALSAAELDHPVPLEALEPCLSADDPAIRVRALELLRVRSEPDVESLIATRTLDGVPGVQRHAVLLQAERFS